MEAYEDNFCVTQDSGRSLAKGWAKRNGRRLHPGFAPKSPYDEQRARSVTPEPKVTDDIVQTHITNFEEALAIYQASAKDKALNDLDVRNAHSWDDISREYELAQTKYAEKTRGWLGLPRRIGRAVGDNSSSVYPFLMFIPDGTYTTVLRAGLFLIFGAASRLSERRQQILETLGGIPFLIQNAEFSFEDFSKDEKLKQEIIELYLVVLQAIMAMMEWLVAKGPWRHIKVLIQGPGYENNLTDMIKSIHQRSSSVQTRVERLTRGAIVTTAATTTKTGKDVEQLKSTAENIKGDTSAMKSTLQDLGADASIIKEDVAQIKRSDKAMNHLINVLQETSRQSECKSSIILSKKLEPKISVEPLRNFTDLSPGNQKGWQEEQRKRQELERLRLEESRKREEAERSQQETETRLRLAEDRLKQHANEHQGMLVRPAQLLSILAVEDPTQISRDVQDVIRRGQISDQSLHGRGHFLMQSPKFQVWLSSAQSRCLLVDGNAESSLERVSAMSVVCALLAQSLPNETARVVTFFCGLNTRMDNALSGPQNLLRNLLAQLIDTYKLSTNFVDGSAYHELQRFDLHRLCTLFVELVKKLPHGAVLFCLIDGISWYENEEWVQETCLVIQTITNLTRDPEIRAVFKILIASPVASRYVRNCVSVQDHLGLPHDVAACDGSPLSRRQMMMQSRRQTVETFDEYVEEDEGYGEGSFDEGNIIAKDV